ncbi:hypothetical protein [Streptacidiphilus sp. ASG 303]|nr:hypothetical protein [Streptacidiphilus sp. ASG 303]MCD0481315.1 hypothetical protein [Streptacidiphilus sp. ASG 303]
MLLHHTDHTRCAPAPAQADAAPQPQAPPHALPSSPSGQHSHGKKR